MTESCNDCYFARPPTVEREDDRLVCRRSVPIYDNPLGMLVPSDWWCGEYRPVGLSVHTEDRMGELIDILKSIKMNGVGPPW